MVDRVQEAEEWCLTQLGLANARGEVARRLAEMAPPRSTEDLLSLPLSRARFLVVDLETTGMKAEKARIIELGAVEVNGFELGRELSTLVNPGVPLPRFISEFTGIREEALKRAPRLPEVLPLLDKIRDGRILVAHNLSFDLAFLNAAYQRLRGETLKVPALCTLKLARRVFPELDSHDLDALARRLRLRPEPKGIKARHRALGDARLAALALIKITVRLSRKGVTTAEELLALQKARRKKSDLAIF